MFNSLGSPRSSLRLGQSPTVSGGLGAHPGPGMELPACSTPTLDGFLLVPIFLADSLTTPFPLVVPSGGHRALLLLALYKLNRRVRTWRKRPRGHSRDAQPSLRAPALFWFPSPAYPRGSGAARSEPEFGAAQPAPARSPGRGPGRGRRAQGSPRALRRSRY